MASQVKMWNALNNWMQIKPNQDFQANWKTDSLKSFLENFGISESQYLQFVTIWKEYAEKGNRFYNKNIYISQSKMPFC